MPIEFEGGCLCEKVRYRSTAKPIVTAHCYCTDCRKIGGTGHATHTVVPFDAFELTGAVTEFDRVADSGNRINRRFCPSCGSALYHTREGLSGMVVIRTSSMDDPELAKPERALYTGSAISWDHLDPDLSNFEKMAPQRATPSQLPE